MNKKLLSLLGVVALAAFSVSADVTISGDYNLAYSGTKANVHYWGGTASNWPGVAMETATGSDGKTYKVAKVPTGTTGVIFNTGGDANKTNDLTYTSSFVMDDNGATSEAVTFDGQVNPDPQPSGDVYVYFINDASWSRPTVWAWNNTGNCNSNGTWPGDAMVKEGEYYKWTAPDGKIPTQIIFSDAGNYKTGDLDYFNKHYYKSDGSHSETSTPAPGPDPDPEPNPDPEPDPTPHPDPVPGGSYYWINADNHYGTNRTVATTGHPASNALSNWTEADQVAQGVARDVCQAIRGKHERPVVDSYAVYASYDATNLYLGVQYVYTIWDLYGEGKQPGESKPYNMDGRLMLVFDLNPSLSHNGVMADGNTIWDSDGKYNTFNNGADAFFLGSTKPGVGNPGFFKPNASGKISYTDPTSCISNHGIKYGYADGLLPSITQIWGQKEFGYAPEALKGDDGFVDLMSEIAASAHTFYEYTIPLSTLGVSESYIKNNGIGVMVVDTYGQGAIGSTPYDPTCFDNAAAAYSKDPSSSKEKEDTDEFTCSFIRIGKAKTAAITDPECTPADEAEPEYYNLQGQRVNAPAAGGIYIRRTGSKVEKVRL